MGLWCKGSHGSRRRVRVSQREQRYPWSGEDLRTGELSRFALPQQRRTPRDPDPGPDVFQVPYRSPLTPLLWFGRNGGPGREGLRDPAGPRVCEDSGAARLLSPTAPLGPGAPALDRHRALRGERARSQNSGARLPDARRLSMRARDRRVPLPSAASTCASILVCPVTHAGPDLDRVGDHLSLGPSGGPGHPKSRVRDILPRT